MANGHIVFRADASISMGIGHVMRCITLAKEMQRVGKNVLFICRDLSGNLNKYIEQQGLAVTLLPKPKVALLSVENEYARWLEVEWRTDCKQVQKLLKGLPINPDWLVVDHYALDIRWELEISDCVGKLFVIDDLANRCHRCHILLDENLFEDMESRYIGLVNANCIKLLGPTYALLRNEFSAMRDISRNARNEVRRVLVFFGGSDPNGETLKVLQAIKFLDRPEIQFDVVVGMSNPQRESISAQCKQITNVTYYCQIDYISELMAAADLSIGAGGSTTMERCCLGLPSIVIPISSNQMQPMSELAKVGAVHLYTGPRTAGSYADLLSNYLVGNNNRQSMIKKGQFLYDGYGARRVANIMINGA